MIQIDNAHNSVKKEVTFCEAAAEEFNQLPLIVRKKCNAILLILERDGRLKEPDGKKLSSTGLFEIRIRIKGQWRVLYAYYFQSLIIILRIFQKKVQKTPRQEIEIAKSRLANLEK